MAQTPERPSGKPAAKPAKPSSTSQYVDDVTSAKPKAPGTTARPSPQTNKTLNYQQLYDLARKHGANDSEAKTLAAIALAESSGRTGAKNTANRNGSTDYGLWQINSIHRPAGFDPNKAYDPDYNAKWAIRLMREAKGFAPWSSSKAKWSVTLTSMGGASPSKGVAAMPAAGQQAAGPVGTSGAGGLKAILDMGMSFIGTPYKWGGSQPGGFDCSGLLQYIFAQNGVAIPRVSSEQARVGIGVKAQEAQAGDLIAFDNSSARPGVDHIGIYLGNGLMLQAPRAGRNVEVVKVDLNKAAAIRRVPQVNTAGLAKQGNKVVYPARAGQGATAPTSISAANGGGDVASSDAGGYDPSTMLGPDGKVDANKAIEVYGYIAELAQSVPDIKATLDKAIMEGWTPTRFQAELQKTKWWKTTSEAQRANEVLKKTNPGEYRARRQAMIDKINIMARRLGATEGTQRVFILAERFLSLGSTDADIERLIAADVRIAPSGPVKPGDPAAKPNTGQAAVTADALRARARVQRVELNDQIMQQWLSAIMRGDQSMDAFESFLIVEAKKRNPDIPQSAFERGETVDSFLTKRDAMQASLESASKAYLVPMSKQALAKWASQIVAGDMTPESFDAYVKEQAKSLFPTLSTAIDRGVTVAQYAEPYRQIAAQTLEINPDDVDFSNPTYGKALMQVDPKTGERASMGLAEFQEYLRKRPEWQKTRQANEKTATLTESILRTFGAVSA